MKPTGQLQQRFGPLLQVQRLGPEFDGERWRGHVVKEHDVV